MTTFFQKSNTKRQKIISDKFLKSLNDRNFDLLDLDKLKANLQSAIELEHSTIPPYLCALYSIKDGTNQFAAQTIRGIVVEEMLHMIMAANILNAIGGSPQINTSNFIPEYPTKIPVIDESFIVDLGKFSKDSINIFLQIEKSADHTPHQPDDFHSIGEFYTAIRQSLILLDETTPGGIFTKDEKKKKFQVTAEQYYGSGGKLISVYCLDDALEAIDEIMGQGEGVDNTIFDPDHKMFGEDKEYAHYFKFNEIYHERKYKPTDKPDENPSGEPIVVDWDSVWNMQKNPKMNDYPMDSELWMKTWDFNKTYMALLNNLHDTCNGDPKSIVKGVALMYDLKYKAQELMKIPIGDDGLMAGPSFEFVT